MTKSLDDVRKELDDKIPRDAISQRDGGSGRSLSYLAGHYVIDRLNKVLGIGNWAFDVADMKLVHSGTNDKNQQVAHYIAKGRLVVELPDGVKTEFTDYGYGDGMDKYSPGKPHELAVKEAATDALKRCAKNLGMSMGLALYDKDQENVEESPRGQSSGPSGSSAAPRAPTGGTGPRPVSPPSDDGKGPKDSPIQAKDATSGSQKEGEAKAKLINLVKLTAKVATDKKKATTEELRAKIKEMCGVDKADQLSEEQASSFLEYLKSLIA